MKLFDKYILKSLFETFTFGVVVFASIFLASEALLDVVRQITKFGIPLKIAMIIVGLRLPEIIVYTIPMAMLVSVILTYNRLNNNLEITSLRSSGVSVYRLVFPAIIFGLMAALLTLFLNEYIVPKASYQARNVMLWAITQRNLPKEKENFTFKELDNQNNLKRLFYINQYKNNIMDGVLVLDFTLPQTTKIIEAKRVITQSSSFIFQNGLIYTISSNGKVSNTAFFKTITLEDPLNLNLTRNKPVSSEYNVFQLAEVIKQEIQNKKEKPLSLIVKWNEKLALPITCILVALVGMPLALSPPRSRMNRGLGFSIIVIFIYYIIRAVSMALGEVGMLDPAIATWLPSLLILCVGIFLLKQKNDS